MLFFNMWKKEGNPGLKQRTQASQATVTYLQPSKASEPGVKAQ